MSSYDIGAITIALTGLLVWNITQEVRLRNVQGKLLLSEQKNLDSSIITVVHRLSDTQLVATLIGDASPGPSADTAKATPAVPTLPKP